MLTVSDVTIDWFGVTIHGTPVFIDQEGVAWERDCGRCPKCYREGRDTPTDYSRRVKPSGYFDCPACGVLYDEPLWAEAESAFITCISDEEAAQDEDPGIRALYREYHGLPPEAGWVWPPRPPAP